MIDHHDDSDSSRNGQFGTIFRARDSKSAPGVAESYPFAMQIRLVRSILPATDGPTKVTAICWSPNSFRLAVATHDRVITLFDENGEQKRDRFSTKPADAARKDYVITGLAWSPDSTKLAVAQSDNIVFVYKVRGAEEGTPS